MKLTPEQIKDIYLYISFGYSQRQTARVTKHTRHTIAHYIQPEVMASEYMHMKWDNVVAGFHKDYEIDILKIDKKFYKVGVIILGLGHIFMFILSLFY